MICKYCGKKIRAGESVCSNCKRPVESFGGNGFWDMSKKPPQREPEPEAEKAPVYIRATEEPKLLKLLPYGLILLLFIIVLILHASQGARIRRGEGEIRRSFQLISTAEIDSLRSDLASLRENANNNHAADARQDGTIGLPDEKFRELDEKVTGLQKSLEDIRISELNGKIVELEERIEALEEAMELAQLVQQAQYGENAVPEGNTDQRGSTTSLLEGIRGW